MESRRVVLPLVRSTPVRFSSVLIDSQNLREDCTGRGGGSSHSSLLASETLVSQTIVSTCQPTQGTSVSERSDHSAPISAHSSSFRESSSLSLAALRQQVKNAGLSDRAAEFSAEAVRDSTRATYDSKLERFYAWCERTGCNPPSASLGQIADFLLHLFDKDYAPNTRLYRSAIASCHLGFEDGSTISSSPFFVSFGSFL